MVEPWLVVDDSVDTTATASHAGCSNWGKEMLRFNMSVNRDCLISRVSRVWIAAVAIRWWRSLTPSAFTGLDDADDVDGGGSEAARRAIVADNNLSICGEFFSAARGDAVRNTTSLPSIKSTLPEPFFVCDKKSSMIFSMFSICCECRSSVAFGDVPLCTGSRSM